VSSFLLAFPPISYMHSSFTHSCCMICPSHPPWLHNSNYTWRRVPSYEAPHYAVLGNFSFFNGSTTLVGLGRFLFQFPNLYTGGRTPWTGDQLVARPLPKHTKTKILYTPLNIHAPKAGFEPEITASERSKTVHALDRSAIATGLGELITL
jgi:hypothetical protein